MEKLWLDENNETEFVFNKEELEELQTSVFDNKDILEYYFTNHSTKALKNVEGEQSILNAVSAAGLEDEEVREKIPPLTQKIPETDKAVIDNFLKAQKLLFFRLEKEPYVYPELLLHLHRELVRDNLDIADYEKGRFRDRYSNEIQAGYFHPTPGSRVAEEVVVAMTNYAYVDKKNEDACFEKIAKLHAQFVRIQPFMDGNKRMAFLLTNAMLKLHGFPIIDLCKNKEESKMYNNALKEAIVNRNVTKLAQIILGKVKDKQEVIIDKIAVDEIEKELLNVKGRHK